MKERPIIMSGDSVRDILSGRKTQTRRIIKLRGHQYVETNIERDGDHWPLVEDDCGEWHRMACPYGTVGDRLWVREAWWHNQPIGADCLDDKFYAADHPAGWHPRQDQDGVFTNYVKRSPIYMSRWASRLTLEVTGVRVERVQDISHSDCVAEGIPATFQGVEISGLRHEFAARWNAINGEGSWEVNPFVWVVEFKQAESEAT